MPGAFRRWEATAAVVLALVLLAACGAPSAAPVPAATLPPPTQAATLPPPTAEAPATAEATPTQAPAAGEISENIGTYAAASVFPSLDPDQMLTIDHNIGFMVYETMTIWDPDKGPQPKLATSWESNADGTEWTFHLRQGVKFHDGTPFNAEAAKFSYERVLEIGLMSYYLDAVEEMQVVDDYTLRFKLSGPRAMAKILSSGYGLFIKSPTIADKPPEWFAEGNDGGSGPYTIESVEGGTRIILTQYKEYWGGWQEGQFTKLVYNMIEDMATREQAIRSGEADVTSGLPFESREALAAAGEVEVVLSHPFTNVWFAFHMDRPAVSDVRVRQALAYAFPYADVQKGAYGGQATLAQGLTPLGLWQPTAGYQAPTYDLEKARSLLQEAGVTSGLELSLELETGTEDLEQIAVLWQAELAKIGVTLKLVKVTNQVWWDNAYNPDNDIDVAMVYWAPGVATPREFMLMFHSTQTFIPFNGYNKPEYDALIDEAYAAEATDAQKANDLYTQAQQMLNADAVGVWALDTPFNYEVRNGVVGLVPSPVYYDVVFWYAMRRQ